MRILLATGGSESSFAAIQRVAAGAWPEHTEVKVVSVVNPLAYSMEEIGLSRSGKTERAHRAINAALRILKSAGMTASGEVVAGWTSRRIVAEAKAWGADLIVKGSRERRGIKRFLSGSVSETVANRAHCSVNIVRGGSVSTKGKSQNIFDDPVKTPRPKRVQQNHDLSLDSISEEYLRRIEQAIPIGRLGEPDVIAHAMLFLASDDAKFITGQKLVVDGAQTLPESVSAV
ncbi:MAG TPA: SDR family oxidoreductase [Pyrinomonadaceae bacterium]|jgi:nucleotide-binding universal stress UspA family protein|nr:SDR family oxidoreductase [Pyrinomonadaceae bacterium]